MDLSQDAIKVIRLYVQRLPKEVVSSKLRTLWNMLNDSQQTAIGDAIENHFYSLLFNATNIQLKQVANILTTQQKTLIFDNIKNDLISELNSENSTEVDFITNAPLEE